MVIECRRCGRPVLLSPGPSPTPNGQPGGQPAAPILSQSEMAVANQQGQPAAALVTQTPSSKSSRSQSSVSRSASKSASSKSSRSQPLPQVARDSLPPPIPRTTVQIEEPDFERTGEARPQDIEYTRAGDPAELALAAQKSAASQEPTGAPKGALPRLTGEHIAALELSEIEVAPVQEGLVPQIEPLTYPGVPLPVSPATKR